MPGTTETQPSPPALPVPSRTHLSSVSYPALPKELASKFCILANTLRFTGGLYWECEDPWDGLGLLSVQVFSSLATREAGASLLGTAAYLDVAEDTPGAGAGAFGDISWGLAGFRVDSHRGGFPGSPK